MRSIRCYCRMLVNANCENKHLYAESKQTQFVKDNCKLNDKNAANCIAAVPLEPVQNDFRQFSISQVPLWA